MLSMVCGFEVSGLSRVDLAADFCPDEHQRSVIRGLDDRTMYVSGKQSGSGFWSTDSGGKYSEFWRGFIPHDLNWGHKTSNIRWKLYYKSKELRDGAGGKGWSKPYIVDMWRECGLDENNVWRLEVSIHNASQFEFMGEKLGYYQFMHNTSNIFKSLYTDRFVVRRNEGHKDKSNDTKVQFLSVGRLHGAFRNVRSEVLAEHHGSFTLLRHLVADVQTEQVLLNEAVRESVLQTIETIVENDGVAKYFNVMTAMDFDSWREWLRVKAYYYGAEHVRELEDEGQMMERALMEAGVVNGDNFLSVPNPPKSHESKQVAISMDRRQ